MNWKASFKSWIRAQTSPLASSDRCPMLPPLLLTGPQQCRCVFAELHFASQRFPANHSHTAISESRRVLSLEPASPAAQPDGFHIQNKLVILYRSGAHIMNLGSADSPTYPTQKGTAKPSRGSARTPGGLSWGSLQ